MEDHGQTNNVCPAWVEMKFQLVIIYVGNDKAYRTPLRFLFLISYRHPKWADILNEAPLKGCIVLL